MRFRIMAIVASRHYRNGQASMPDLLGTNIKDPVRPYNTDCTYPTALANEIAGGLKYVASEDELTGYAFTPERRPVGTVAGVGIGKFRQWTGSVWVHILEGMTPPTAVHSASQVTLRFETAEVPIRAVSASASGVMTAALYTRLMQHGAKHFHDGDDPMTALTAMPDRIPQADGRGKLSPTWLPLATKTEAGTVRVADDGEELPDIPGAAIAVVRSNDSRLLALRNILEKLEAVRFPIHYVDILPPKAAASPQAFYWLNPAETLYLLVNNAWMAIAGREVIGKKGESAYEVAVNQGYTGSLAEWLLSLVGPAGLSAYRVAVEAGYRGTVEEWLLSLQGKNGKSNYELAKDAGFPGTLQDWLESTRGEKGDPGKSLVILDYFPTWEKFENAGLVPEENDLYCVEGDLYRWTGTDWKYLGPLLHASVFEYEFELWANQPNNEHKTLEDFFREVITESVSGNLENVIRQEVSAWLRDNLGNLFDFEFEIWTSQPENSQKTFVDFMQDLIRQEVAAWLEAN